MHAGFTSPREALNFIFSGNATFTVTSSKTGKHFTYKVKMLDDPGAPFMVSVLNGPDNWENYLYIGCVPRNEDVMALKAGRRGRPDAPSYEALKWTLKYLQTLETSNVERISLVSIQHAGKCGRCGRKLTRPESIDLGIGPECAMKEIQL